ncbi:YkvA family protein [Alkalihalobacillus sp. 1P02AB]|uniref:YkvA family protein n=1 Tax=Alkalihalobacillus sp. 1P02AB TaxID=3132260 RepID=UPI0039A73CF6
MKLFFRRAAFLLTFWRSIPKLFRFYRIKEIKLSTKLLYTGALFGYLLLPYDLIPDFIIGLGFVDDVLVVGFLLDRMIRITKAHDKKRRN